MKYKQFIEAVEKLLKVVNARVDYSESGDRDVELDTAAERVEGLLQEFKALPNLPKVFI